MGNRKEELETLSNDLINSCGKCRSERVKVSYGSLPVKWKEEFKSDIDSIEYCLYCSKCDKYSATLKGDFYDSEETKGSIKFKSLPS
jgi:hypothetical protein